MPDSLYPDFQAGVPKTRSSSFPGSMVLPYSWLGRSLYVLRRRPIAVQFCRATGFSLSVSKWDKCLAPLENRRAFGVKSESSLSSRVETRQIWIYPAPLGNGPRDRPLHRTAALGALRLNDNTIEGNLFPTLSALPFSLLPGDRLPYLDRERIEKFFGGSSRSTKLPVQAIRGYRGQYNRQFRKGFRVIDFEYSAEVKVLDLSYHIQRVDRVQENGLSSRWRSTDPHLLEGT